MSDRDDTRRMGDAICDLVAPVHPGARIRLMTLRKSLSRPAARLQREIDVTVGGGLSEALRDPVRFSDLVLHDTRLTRVLFRDRTGAWWRRRFSAQERTRAVLDLNNAYWTLAGPRAVGSNLGLRVAVIEPLVAELRRLGVVTLIGVADANLPYLVDRSTELEETLDELVIVAGGTPADGEILDRAERHPSLIVSNDRFRDWKRSSRWRKRNIERLRVPIGFERDADGTYRIDCMLAADELRFDLEYPL